MTDTIFKPGEYVTRDGRKARVYATDGGWYWPIHGAVYNDGAWRQMSWTCSGHQAGSDDLCPCDLMPPKQVRYCNVYRDGEMTSGFLYADRAIADIYASRLRIACIRIEFTEGQYDD